MFLTFIIFTGIAVFAVLMYQDYLKEKEEIKQYGNFLKGTNVTLDEFIEERNKMDKKFSENDVLWAIYNKRLLNSFFKKEFWVYRVTLYDMLKLLHKEKNNREELRYCLKILYYDLSGVDKKTPKKSLMIVPDLYKRIIKFKECFTENMIDDCFKIKFPFHYCNKEIFSNIVNDIFLEENLAIILDKYLDEMKKEPKEAQPININELVEVARNEINSKK
ncbi:hypothetical protein [Fusobacterium polymorphum]|uniref:hypothetical protein n=2 Tax=Fusobacterium nucleatum subsp. polymorphum TaxID=76857 RepID=UPI00300BE366